MEQMALVGSVVDSELTKFTIAIRGARFLFSKEIQKYYDELWKKIFDLKKAKAPLPDLLR
jgi:hypothetical protein